MSPENSEQQEPSGGNFTLQPGSLAVPWSRTSCVLVAAHLHIATSLWFALSAPPPPTYLIWPLEEKKKYSLGLNNHDLILGVSRCCKD